MIHNIEFGGSMIDNCTVTRSDLGDTVVLAVTGPLDACAAPSCLQALGAGLATIPPGHALVVDLHHVEFIAAAGVRVLFRVTDAARHAGIPLRIAVAAASHLRSVIERIDIDGRLPLGGHADHPARAGDARL